MTVLTAEIGLVEIPKFRSLVVLGYPDVPLVNSHDPLACEGLDDVVISLEREEHLAGAAQALIDAARPSSLRERQGGP